MPFDYQGARTAGYSDAEIASFLGQQAGFDTDGAIKSGYKPDEIIPFLTDRLNQRDNATTEQPVVADQPQPLGDPMGTGFAETAQPPAPPEAGGGRGFVNPPAVGAKRDVGAAEAFGRGWGESGAKSAKYIAATFSSLPVIAESVINAVKQPFGGKADYSWQDAAFRELVDPAQNAVDYYALKPDEKMDLKSKIANGVGGLLQDLPAIIASGGLAEAPAAVAKNPGMMEFVGKALSTGFDAMRPVILKAAGEKADQVLESGGSPRQAAVSALTAGMWAGINGAVPMSMQGSRAVRAVTGFPVGAATGEAGRVIQNAADPDNLQQPFDIANTVVSGVQGSLLAAGMPGHVEAPHDLRTPEAVQTAEAEGVSADTPKIADVGRVLQAQSVDEAIEAAKAAANPAPEGSIRSQMLAIWPLETPNVSRDTALPAEPARADGGRLADATAGVEPGARSDAEPVQRLAAEPASIGAEGESVPPRIADAVAREVAPPAASAAVPEPKPLEALSAREVESKAAEITVRRNDSGTVTVKGDPAAVAALLRAHEIPFVPSAEGAVVGRSRATDAERVVQDFAPTREPAESAVSESRIPAAVEAAQPTPTVRLEPPVHPTPGIEKPETISGFSQKTPKVERLEPVREAERAIAAIPEEPSFRRSDTEPTVGKRAQIHRVVSTLTRDWLRKPDIHVLGSMDEAPEPVRRVWEQQNSQGAVGNIEGFHWKGGVYLIGDALQTKGDVQRVLFHEALGHFGLRGVFGDRLNGILNEIAAALPKEITRKADQYGLDLANKRDRLTAAEEVLAEMAQTRPEMSIVKRAVAAIRTFLREHGIDSLKMTRDEIIANYLLPARGYVERGRNPEPGFAKKEASFSRDDPNEEREGASRFVKSPSGSIDFGEVSADMGRIMRRQAGKIRLEEGNDLYGLRHIENRHGASIRAAGFPDASAFVHEVATHFNKIYQPEQTAQLVLLETGAAGTARRMFVELQLGKDGDRDYYTVRTAYPSRTEAKNTWKVLWEGDRAQSPAASGERPPFAAPSDEASGTATNPPGQSKGIVPPNEPSVLPRSEQRTIEVDGQRRPAENDRGELIHPTFQGTSEFWRRFGDRFEKDAQGRPKVGPDEVQRLLDENGIRPQFARAAESDADLPEEVRAPYAGPGAKMLHAASDLYTTLRNDLMMGVAPMSATNNKQAQAMAQKYANQTRWAQVQWGRLSRLLEANFTAEERQRMWEAADEENVARIRERDEEGYSRPEGVGLASLTEKQREAVDTLHEYGQGLWRAAQAEGMVEGEGLPFWTPRMLVTIGEDGDIGKLRSLSGGPKTASSGEGRNISTTAQSLKHRKHLTAEETEAAGAELAKQQGAAGAKVVRDIMTMPLAMYRLERAIAGRRLINQIKAIGQATGEELVRDGHAEGYITIAHPAFMQYRPRFTKDAEGKTVPMTDADGNVVMDRVPLYIRKDFEGPLKAIMSTQDSSWYTGYMLLKSKAMSAIMFSPLIHNMVIWGKAMPASPVKMLTLQLYVKGHGLLKDNGLMREAVEAGMVPIGENHSQSIDVTDIAQNFKPMGDRWGNPDESWITLGIEALGNAIHDGAGTQAKKGMDAAGEFLHHTMLWKQIGALQMGIYADAKARYQAKGYSEAASQIMAAHLANRYGGVVAKENQSELARKAANILLFSRSFNFTNLGTIKDTWAGMPSGLKAMLSERVPADEAKRAVWEQRRKAWGVIALDVGFAIIATSLVQDLVDSLKKDKPGAEIVQGYIDRAKAMGENIAERPAALASWNPYQLSSTWANEPGKKNRVDMGASIGDRHEYMRLPTGKVAEDLVGWVTDTLGTAWNKGAPIPKAISESMLGHNSLGQPIEDPNGSVPKRIGEGVAHVMKAQLPWDDITRVYDWMQGHATELDKKKVVGTVTGFTFSQGHPGGPEAAVNQQTSDRFEQSRRYTMQLVKDDLKRGDEDKARERMEEIGMTPREINRAIQQALEPRSGLSKQARQKFERRANEEEREEMDRQRAR
jgi:hypothetical protein